MAKNEGGSRSNVHRSAATGRFLNTDVVVKGAFKISPLGTMREAAQRVSRGGIARDWDNVGSDLREAMKREQAARDKQSR